MAQEKVSLPTLAAAAGGGSPGNAAPTTAPGMAVAARSNERRSIMDLATGKMTALEPAAEPAAEVIEPQSADELHAEAETAADHEQQAETQAGTDGLLVAAELSNDRLLTFLNDKEAGQ